MVSFSISLTITSSFFSTQPPTTEIYTLSLHDALPISCPLLRLERQSALDRIAMHVAQLLHTLAFAPHHKIIESPLPLVAFVQCVLPQPVLAALTALAPISQNLPREALF